MGRTWTGNRGPVRSLYSSHRHDSTARRIFDSEILERMVGQPCYLINQDIAFPLIDHRGPKFNDIMVAIATCFKSHKNNLHTLTQLPWKGKEQVDSVHF